MSMLQALEDYLAEQILSPQGYAQHRAGKVSKKELLPFLNAIASISESYVAHVVGNSLPSPIRNVEGAEGYALYYTPINAAKVLHLLPMINLPAHEIRVLDLGCGPGTVGLALLSSLPHPIELTCVEHSQPMRTTAERLLSQFRGGASLAKLSMLTALPPPSIGSFDLIFAANVLAELEGAHGEELILDLAERLSPHGYLVALEPGQPLHTRRLMQLRDKVLQERPEMTPLFPCLRADPCPMLRSSESDWCHGSMEWSQPRLSAHLDDLLSFNKHRIKYSAFIFQRRGSLRDGIRVLTPPEKTRFGIETLVCGEGIYGPLRIRKGCRSERTRALEKARVFDRLRLSEPCKDDVPEHITIERCSE